MQPHLDPTVFYILGVIYALTFGLILYRIETTLRIVGRIRCLFGRHKRIKNPYVCEICKKRKPHPHLKLIEGGKKDLGSPFRW